MTDKKKLKQDYKLLVEPKGVFALKNKINGRVFLGSSLNLKNKEVRVKMLLKMGSHPLRPLQEDWNTFGEDAFEYEVLEQLELKDDPNYNYGDDLEILEAIWLDKFQPFTEKCYNKNDKIRIV